MIFRFEGFELEEERRELRRGAERIPLPRKSFDVLRYLVQHAGRLVPKTELFAALWPREHVVEAVLPVHVRTIRKALGDGEASGIIRTVRSRGYSVSCPVERAVAPPPDAGTGGQAAAELPLLGRAELLQELGAELRSAAAGHGRAVLLHGAPGIGKSRVLEEIARVARSEGSLVLAARAEPFPTTRPLGVMLELLRSAQRALERGPLRAAAEQQGFELRRAQAALREVLSPGATRGLDPRSSRVRLTRTVLQLAARASRIAPLVLAIDDLQHVDAGSLRLLAALIRQLREQRILVLAAYRDGEAPAGERLAAALRSLASEPAIRQIALSGLGADAAAELVRAEHPDAAESAPIHALAGSAAGNPFALRELLRLQVASDALRGAPEAAHAALPGTRGEILELRLSAISAECRELLAWAAVIGTRFSTALLERVSEHSGRPLLERLEEARGASLIRSEGSPGAPDAEHCFAHALIREHIEGALCPAGRAQRHGAVARALQEQLPGARREPLLALAHHFVEAGACAERERASDYCVRAARAALRALAPEDAAEHFARALGAEQLHEPPDRLRIACLRLAAADALHRAARCEPAHREFLRAAEVARELGRADLLALAALGLARWTGLVGATPGFPAQSAPSSEQRREALDTVEEALDALRELPELDGSLALSARLLAVLARAEARARRYSTAAALADRAIDAARRSHECPTRFEALLARRISLQLPQDAEHALAAASGMMEIAHELGAEPLRFAACEARIPALIALGDMERAGDDLAVAADLAARLRVPEFEYTVARFRLGRALGEGALGAVRPLLEHTRYLGCSAGDPLAPRAHQLILLWLLYAEGRSAVARPGFAAVAERGGLRGPAAHAFAADFWRGLGDTRRCAEHFEQAAAEKFEDLEIDGNWLWTLCTLADVCAELGDAQRAQRLYERIAPHAAFNVTSSLYTYRGSAHHPLARLARVLGDARLASSHFEAAIEFNARIGARAALLFAQAHYGRALLEYGTGERARGSALLEQVRQEADQLGIPRLRRAPDPAAIL